ncbi:dnaJ homolog subfamily C member 30, mitochondrial-like [Contarinia nasturtii]|uniref:dnaJ homolog subfamily C member 30, mitochondrial-like n=1 Tax=Contarinia nasturtii TaxID=265458 RepID=UPI0012D46418|nr:dnaJ homolog subfamily C member 30, mitochondrial-like [Contarinia nasturtii]
MANLGKHSKKYLNQNVCAIFGCVSNASNNVCNTLRPPTRTFSRTSHMAKSRNFYVDLEIPRTATQSEIKNAYYNLSMAYHPDKNKGCDEAAKRFRLISEAYEILGNVRTRRLYDKGIGSYAKGKTHSPGTETEVVEVEVEDDAQTKFYKQHMVKSQPPIMADRMTARDLDDWSKSRITECFERHQNARQKLREEQEDKELSNVRGQQIQMVYVLVVLLFIIGTLYEIKQEQDLDATLKAHREKKS